MGLPLRITFEDRDYKYEIINSKLIGSDTTELELLLDGVQLHLTKNVKREWELKNLDPSVDPKLVQALGRSVSLRLRM